MSHWQITGRCFLAPPPANWRERLARRLGYKPRRIGTWAELMLYGALCCLDDAGEPSLPDDALLSVSSLFGPIQALHHALAEAQDGQPLPLGFLQSQPNQALTHLNKALQWQGNARYLTTRTPLEALRLACRSHVHAGGVLLGWVSELDGGSSQWLRLRPLNGTTQTPLPISLDAFDRHAIDSFTLS